MYQDYYTGKRQFGSSNMPVFVSAKYQCSHGLSNIFSRLFWSILLPFIKGNAPSWAGKAVKTGLNLVCDESHSVPFKQSVKKEVPKALKEVVEDTKFQLGSGVRNSKHRRLHSHCRCRQRRSRRGGGNCGRRRQYFNDIFA